MHVVFIASEMAPYAKTGGLGDVVGALPQALAELGHEVSVFIPLYASSRAKVDWVGGSEEVVAPVAHRPVVGSVRETSSATLNVRIFLLEQPEFFDRPGLYTSPQGSDYTDNCARFTWFCRAALNAIEVLDLPVDCIHVHDWQTGLVPVLLKDEYRYRPRFIDVHSFLTIHNLAFQGIYSRREWYVTGLRQELFSIDGLEYYGNFSLLKGGLVFADQITTVSQTYAEEIKGREFGHGMEGILQQRAADLTGIVNGIDYTSWDPATDRTLAANYDVSDWKRGKSLCKQWLQQRLGLEQSNLPIVGLVGRLTEQKGLDLLERIGPTLLEQELQLVVLGTGSKTYEDFLRGLSRRFSEKCAAVIGFDEELARQIYAGSDMFLMPSRFEPCGLSQLYSLRYGTIPIVRAVGGLVDTVTDANPRNLAAGIATGFQFLHYSPVALLSAVRRALDVFREPDAWDHMVRFAMAQDWSWVKSARQYSALYAKNAPESVSVSRSKGNCV